MAILTNQIPEYTSYPPSGLDRADGTTVYTNGTLTGVAGTANPTGAVVVELGQFLEELPTSPEIERGENATIVHTFMCDATTARTLIISLGRGVVIKDSAGNLARILTTSMKMVRGNVAEFRITSEGISFDFPPDEFEIEVVDFSPPIEYHPRYRWLGPKRFQQIQALASGSNLIASTEDIYKIVEPMSDLADYIPATNSVATYADVFAELLQKKMRGIDTFYLAGFKINWHTYHVIPPFQNPGGYLEDPFADGGLPCYFWSDNEQPDGYNVITNYAAYVNPMFYGNGMSWLRQADSVTFNRTWFRLTSSWIGGPAGGNHVDGGAWKGQWDEQIYSREFIEYGPSEDLFKDAV